MSLPVAPYAPPFGGGINGLISPLSPLYAQLGNNGGGGGDLNAAIAGMSGGGGLMGVTQGAPNPSGMYNGQFSMPYNTAPVAGAGQGGGGATYNGQFSPQFDQSVGQGAAPMSPLDQLLSQEQQQLAGIGNVSNYEMPYSQIQSMAQNMTNAQYDPQINNLLGQMAQQKQLTAQNQGKASSMYNALGDSFINDIPQVQQQVKGEADATKAQYGQAQQQLQQQYQQQSGDQQAALQKLGIQAAQGGGSAGNDKVAAQNAPGVQGVGEQQGSDQKYLQGQMSLQNQQAQNMLGEQGNSAVQYQQAMADSSRLQGSNDVTNLQNALQNYLTGAQTQQQSLVGAKASALAGMEGQLNWQNIQNAQTQYQNAFNRVLAENNFGLDVQKEGDSNTNAMNSLLAALQENTQHYGQGTINMPGTTGNSGGATGAAAYLANLYGSGGSQTGQGGQQMSNILQAVENGMADAQAANNKSTGNGQRPQTTDPFYFGYVQQELAKEGVTDPNSIAAAYQALLAYNQHLK